MELRFSVMTLNLWNTEHLDIRIDSIIRFFKINKPDILCIQELRKETLSLLQSQLEGYKVVEDSFIGWQEESNIFYNTELFSEIEHGRIDLIMPEVNRGLFYLRLKVNETNNKLFISTIHLTHQGNKDELETGKSYRHEESIKLSNAINRITKIDEGVIVCGDFNDPIHPSRIISLNTSLVDVFKTLCLESPVTFPCSTICEEFNLVQSIDKIFHNGMLEPIMATSPRIVLSLGISDHYPVVAMFKYKKI
jgi:endonuclease/exonuclease/phosphatase (EEP) superfamily protein YafD